MQVGQSEQRLRAGLEAPPPGSALFTVAADTFGEVVQRAAGQQTRGGMGRMARLPVGASSFDRQLSDLEPRTHRSPGLPHPS